MRYKISQVSLYPKVHKKYATKKMMMIKFKKILENL